VPVLLTVGFVTMYLNDIQRSGFYAAIGFGCAYDIYVIKKTNETAAQVFPVMLDVESGVCAAGCLCKNNEVECDRQLRHSKFLQFFEAAFLHLEWLAVPATLQ